MKGEYHDVPLQQGMKEARQGARWSGLTGQMRGVGEPRSLAMSCRVSSSVFAGKRGSILSSSARMQPAAHISIASVYSSEPRSSSGALHIQQREGRVYHEIAVSVSYALGSREPLPLAPRQTRLPEAALYNIAFRYSQSSTRGTFSKGRLPALYEGIPACFL